MLLKTVDIQGFKTFPDKTSLKFEDKMVAVVGPNGSGKSNVSDAIRWVLGEQSARILRCSKMEDVIFKGTTSRKALGYAEVTMNIDNTDRTLNFDNDNLSITRRYYRSGESEYLINKASVRLKDINELFMDTGLGRDGYSIIGQGKIDSIVAAKSEERREIFEEASGISRYRYKKEESERRLSRAEENLVRLRDILSELEGRVEPLRVQAEKASKFIEFDREKRGLEIGVWVRNLSEFEKVLREQGEKTQITLAQHNEIEDKLEKINLQNQENYNENSRVNVQIEEQRNIATTLDEDVLRANGEISVFDNDILHNLQNIKRIDIEIEEANSSNENIDAKILEKQNEIEVKNIEIDALNKEYIDLSYQIENLRKDTDLYQSKINNFVVSSSNLNANIANEKIKLSSYIASKDEVENRGESLQATILENQNNKIIIKNKELELTTFINEINSKLEEKNNSLNGYSLMIKGKSDKLNSLKIEIDNLTLNANEQSRRAKLLEDLERNFEGFANSVKAVMKESERGFLKGVHGPVTKLIKTPREYAVAIETALGGAMQNIVVGTDQDAKNAINLLKKRESGRATFLPLTTIKGNVVDVKEVEDIYGFIGVASKLVECDPNYNGIKNSLLGRTVIAQDLDSAVVIAKKSSYRFRVVSLDGQVVNSGGSLTGGSQARNSGLLSRATEIERIREKAKEVAKQAQEKVIIYKELLAENNNLVAQAKATKSEIIVINEDKIRTISEINSTKKEFENILGLEKQLEYEKTNSAKRIEQLNFDMNITNNLIKEFEVKLAKINQSINEVNSDKASNQTVSDEITFKMQEIKMKSLAAQKDKEAFESVLYTLKERKTDSESIFAKLEEQKQNHNKNIIELKEAIVNTQEKIDEIKISIVDTRELIENLTKKRDELEIASVKLRDEERVLLSQRENAGKELARLQERMDSLQKEYDTIIKKLWEEYELTRKEASDQAIEIEDIKAANLRLVELRSKIRGLGSVNLSSIEEYKEVSQRYGFLKEQVDDVEKSKSELVKLISELTHQMKGQFAVRFAEIASNFTSIFKELFGGGTASLTFTDENDILNSGIEIKVHPPGKIVSHIEALSGGEKALVAISIYFAIMKVNPPPFCMLDEVEAALDDVNVRRFAEYLQRMNENTQFIVITHRRGTMESADMLYGVTMQDDGISKLLALKTSEIDDNLGVK